MPSRNILVVAVDGLRASALGAYGNTAFPTPALDRFAAQSFLLDACFAPAPDLADIYQALWHSIHPALPTTEDSNRPSLARLLAQRGYTTALVTDSPELVQSGAVEDFDHCAQIARTASDDLPANRAETISQTSLARFFALASEAVAAADARSPCFVWVHARGLYGPWDAPLDLQHSLLDDGDPPPVESLDPPDLVIENSDDPDAIFRYGCAYAAQVMALDACWNGLMESIERSGADDQWLVTLIGVRGLPLGEHRRVGGVDPRLYGEQLHVPWLIRFPDAGGRLVRSGRLTSPLDLPPTLLEAIDAPEPGPSRFDGMSVLPLIGAVRPMWREALVSVSAAGHRAIRTDDWCLRQEPAVADHGELYVRPDDRWEANDVAKLCREELEALAVESRQLCRRPT